MNPTGTSTGRSNAGTGRANSGNGRYRDIVPEGYELGQIRNFTPQQMRQHESLYKHVQPGSYLDRLASGDESLYQEMEAPAMRQFNELIGGLSTRFSAGSGQGSLGTRRSSGFQNAGTAAASNFAQELQSNRQGLMRQGYRDLFELTNLLMGQKPYERTINKEPAQWWEGPVNAFASGVGEAGGKALFGGF